MNGHHRKLVMCAAARRPLSVTREDPAQTQVAGNVRVAVEDVVPIAAAPPVMTAIRSRSESCGWFMASHRSKRLVWPGCDGVRSAERLVVEPHASAAMFSRG